MRSSLACPIFEQFEKEYETERSTALAFANIIFYFGFAKIFLRIINKLKYKSERDVLPPLF